MITINRICVF